MVAGAERLTFAVEVCPAVTVTEFWRAVPKLEAETFRSYLPAASPVNEYVPFAAVVVEALTAPFCSAWTVAPLIALLSALLETVPDNVPVVTAVNVTPLLTCWPTLTVTGPVLTLDGAAALIEVALQPVTLAGNPLKRTTLVPWLAPKFWPEIVTAVPAAPVEGEMPVMLGPGDTVKAKLLLLIPPAVTTRGPVVAPEGTGTTMLPSLQLKGVATVPLKVTLPLPCGMPNPDPLIVICVFTAPLAGETPLIAGGGITVKLVEFDATPCVTITGPVVAPEGIGTTICVLFQLAGVALVPLKLIRPATVPKFVPATVTEEPTRAESGEILLMLGAGTVKLTPLLTVPLPEVTTILPLFVSAETGATIDVLLQLVMLAAVPLNVTDPVPWVAPKLLPLIVTAVPAGPETGDTELMAGTGSGVTVTASVEVLNLSVTLCLLPAVFFSRRIPLSRSVVFVVSVVVTRQLYVLTPVVESAVLIVPTLQSELRTVAVEFTCEKQTSDICTLAFVVVFSTANEYVLGCHEASPGEFAGVVKPMA